MQQEITSFFHGFQVDQFELLDRLTRMGYKVDKIEEKPEGYQAKLKDARGITQIFVGKTVETALANALISLMQIHQRHHQSALQKTWTHMLPDIARAYAKAPTFDYKAAPSWKNLADDDAIRAKDLKSKLQVEYTHEPTPYHDQYDLAKDVSNGKVKISLADLKHPIWTPSQHLDHRLTHSVLGQAPAGGGFNWVGANQAMAHHMPYLSDQAKEALFTNDLGHRAYQIHYGSNGPRKIAHLGFLKGGDIGDDLEDGEDSDTIVPWSPKQSSINENFETGIEPPYPNPFLDTDPLRYLDLREDAKKTARPWHTWERVIDDD